MHVVSVSNVHKLMKANGWSQSELARRAGLSRQCVNQVLNYRRTRLLYATVLKLARAFGVSISEFTNP